MSFKVLVGYNSGGKFKSYKEHVKIYRNWTDMFARCYSERQQIKQPRYIGCSVDDGWQDYQDYAQWYVDNKYCGRENWQIDKDILINGNKIYGPDFCCVVPQEINLLIGKRNACRGEYPIGVEFHTSSGKFRARMSVGGHHKHICLCDTPEDAFSRYKEKKEEYIKRMADKYKDVLDGNVYSALYNYSVLITD